MPRKPFFAANWKMHIPKEGIESYLEHLTTSLNDYTSSHETVIFPSFPYIMPLATQLSASGIAVGAQNMYHEAEGAFTGEVSASMITGMGATHVIVGHSERRAYFGETDDIVHKKLSTAISSNLIPILCVGESTDERKHNKAFKKIEEQLSVTLKGIKNSKLVIAYEPIWAIGTGDIADADQAQEMHAFIRAYLSKNISKTFATGTRIIYGGSVKSEYMKGLMKQKDIDGVLVGGASLNSADFIRIVTGYDTLRKKTI